MNLRRLEFVDSETRDDRLILRLSERDRKAIEHVDAVCVLGIDADDETIQTLAMLPRLNDLSIRGDSISDRGVAVLMGCRRLRSLALYDCSNITEHCIDSLIAIPNLVFLSIHDCPIVNERNIERFSTLPQA